MWPGPWQVARVVWRRGCAIQALVERRVKPIVEAWSVGPEGFLPLSILLCFLI